MHRQSGALSLHRVAIETVWNVVAVRLYAAGACHAMLVIKRQWVLADVDVRLNCLPRLILMASWSSFRWQPRCSFRAAC